MLKLLILAALFGLLARMLKDLWRQWLSSRLAPPAAGKERSVASAELRRCQRCGVYAPAPRISLPGARFLCRRCRASAA